MLERSRIIEIVVAVGAVVVMIGLMVGIGLTQRTNGALTIEGAHMLVGAIVGFILLLTAVGVTLAYTLEETDGGADGSNAG